MRSHKSNFLLQQTVIYFYLLFPELVKVDGSFAATHLLLTHVGPCSLSPRPVLTLKELSINTHTYDSRLTGEFNISEDVENGWTVKATMQKCQDIRNTDTCDYYNSYRMVRNGCGDDAEAEETYDMLFHYTAPEIECPIRAGVYNLIDYPIFTEDNYLTVSESKISTSVFGYTFMVEGTTVDMRKFFCVEAHLQLLYMREHNWLGGKHKQTTITPKDDEVDGVSE